MKDILNTIAENPQYATIVAAIITALGAIVAAVIAKEKQKKKNSPPVSQETVTIPPPVDPLSHLRSNLGGIKDIDKMDIHSDEYYKTLATRIMLQKNDKTRVKISRRGKHGS